MTAGSNVRKWHQRNPEKHRRLNQDYYDRGANHDHNSRSRWLQEDIEEIMNVDPDAPTDHELAKKLGRTVKAVDHKRSSERARLAGNLPAKSRQNRQRKRGLSSSDPVDHPYGGTEPPILAMTQKVEDPSPKKDEKGRLIIPCVESD